MLTRSGLGVAVSAIILAVCGWWWGYEELIAVAAAAAVAVGIAVWSARASVRTIVDRFIDQPRVARGDPIRLTYQVTNPARRRSAPMRLIDRISVAQASELAEAETDGKTSVELPPIASGDTERCSGLIATHRRGKFIVGPWTVERVDPLGLAAGQRTDHHTSTVIVHPRIHLLSGPQGAMHSFDDDSQTRTIASDPLSGFMSLREYVDGDDPRLIHWPTTARMGTLMLREHVEQRRPEFTVVLDCAEGVATPSDFEEMVDVTASIAVHALRNGVNVRLATTSRAEPGTVRPLERDTMVLDLLTPVAQVELGDVMPLVEVFHAGLHDATIVFVTGPNGPSSTFGHTDRVTIVRVGDDARLEVGITLAVETAEEFAERWRPWH